MHASQHFLHSTVSALAKTVGIVGISSVYAIPTSVAPEKDLPTSSIFLLTSFFAIGLFSLVGYHLLIYLNGKLSIIKDLDKFFPQSTKTATNRIHFLFKVIITHSIFTFKTHKMKKLLSISLVFFTAILLNSCGSSLTTVLNQNQSTTQVHLNSNNYKIVDKVSGSAEVTYIMFIGGMNQTQLFENAYSNMVSKANLESGSKALINIVTEDHIGGVIPFYYKRTTTVSAHVIEFTR